MRKKLIIIVLIIILLPLFILGFRQKVKSPTSTLNTTSTPTSQTQTNSSEAPTTTTTKHDQFSVPILMYHYIRGFNDPSDKIGTNLSVSPESFDRQLQYLQDHGYQSITPSQIITKNLPDKPVMISFDDGYADAYTQAFPILKKHHFIGVFYIITSDVGKDEYLSWNNISEMQKTKMVIASHTVSHPDLAKASLTKVDQELSDSKKALEDHLGIQITDLCYPSGKYSDQVIEEAKKIGYTNATTTHSGIANESSNQFELPRLRIENGTNLAKILK